MRKLLYGLIFLSLAVFCLGPLLFLVSKTDFSTYQSLFQEQTILRALWNTLSVSLLVALGCLGLGLPLAWLITRTDIPYRGKWASYLTLPYAIPSFVGAIGWIILANPSSGILNTALGLGINIYSYWGLVFVEINFLFTFVFLTCLASLQRMDSSLEEAARLSGAGPFRVFVDISLPLLKPAILSGAVLSFLATAASFGVPSMIGGPARVFMLTTQIYTQQKMGSENGIRLAIALSVILMISSIALLWLNQGLVKKSQYQLVAGKAARASLVVLGKWRWPSFAGLCCVFFIIFVLPISAIMLSAFSRVQGVLSVANLTLANFERVLFDTDETPRALMNSLGLAIVVASVCTVLALGISYFQVKTKIKGRRLLEIMASLPYSTPGTVVGLAMIISFSQGFWGVGPSLYNTLLLIGMAYVIKLLSLAVKTTSDGYMQIHDSLVEAARVSGANSWQSFKDILLPILFPALVSSWILVFMPAMSELTMTVLLTGPGLETIGTLIFQLQEYSDIGGGGAAVLSVILIVFVLSLNFLMRKLSKGKLGI